MTAEKGSQWTRLRVRGTPGHGSTPYRSDNALVKAAEVITRIARYKAPLRLDERWKRILDGLDLPAALRVALSNPATFDLVLDRAPAGAAPIFYAATRTTFSGIFSARSNAVSKLTLNVRRSRVFTPIKSHPASTARFSSSSS